MSISAMKQALEALENYVNVVTSSNDPNDFGGVVDGGEPARKACDVLRQAIEQAEKCLKEWPESKADHLIVNPEIAKMLRDFVHASDMSQERVDETAKRKHEWIGLHEHELRVLGYNDPSGERLKLAKAVEAKLREKNA